MAARSGSATSHTGPEPQVSAEATSPTVDFTAVHRPLPPPTVHPTANTLPPPSTQPTTPSTRGVASAARRPKAAPKRKCDVVGASVKLSVTSEDGEVIEIDLPVHKPTMGPPVIDVSRVLGDEGWAMRDYGTRDEG